jgi:hypothetical protein
MRKAPHPLPGGAVKESWRASLSITMPMQELTDRRHSTCHVMRGWPKQPFTVLLA